MSRNKLFFFDTAKNKEYTFEDLFKGLNQLNSIPAYIHTYDYFEIFLLITASLIHQKHVTLLDFDFRESELLKLGLTGESLGNQISLSNKILVDKNNFYNLLRNSTGWELTLFTSGTTGQPKKISHSFENLTRMVKISDIKGNDVWGFAYNPTHIAGIQVFFQALLNLNSIINLFGQSKATVYSLIRKFNITNISATPTFYRMLVPHDENFNSVKKITSGGECFDQNILELLKKVFPGAKILNIYASTEAGSLFSSKSNTFTLNAKNKDFVKIRNGELLVHKSLLGFSDVLGIEDWYNTNDMVEIIHEDPLTFRFIYRKNEMINVGGNKINPNEVEEILNRYPGVNLSKVYGKKNSILGNILMADIKTDNENITEKELKSFLKDYLQPVKIPRVINLVNTIETTRSGKLKRI